MNFYTKYKKIIKAICIFLPILLILGFVWLNGYRFNTHRNDSTNATITVEKVPEEPTIKIDTLESSLVKVASLSTAEYHFKDVATLNKDKAKLWFVSVPFTDSKLIIKYEGLIKAGIKDCSNIKVDIDALSQQIIVSCPEIEIFDEPVIYKDSIEIYDQSDNVFNPVTLDDFVDFQATVEKGAKQQASESKIVETAKNNMTQLLTYQVEAFIENTKCKDYQISIKYISSETA